MRIIHILNHSYRLSGQVHAAVDLACAQAQLGHTVAICSAGGSFDALLASHGVETMILNQQRRPLTVVKAMAGLFNLIRRWRPDVVHAHMMTSALLAWPLCKLTGVGLVTTVHNSFQKGSIVMALGDRVIAVSGAVGQSMAQRGVPSSRLRVVLNGTIGAARFESVDRTPLRIASPSIVYVGGLHPRKGVADLIEAFALVRRTNKTVRMVVVGEGPHSAQYISAAAERGCAEAISFVGEQANPQPYLLGADIFVLPSHADPAPLVLSEAREAGCAIIATQVDGIPELLEQGRAGVLTPPRDPATLAAAMSKLLDDPEQLTRWRQNSQININHLSITRVANETIAIYEECAHTARKPMRARAREIEQV